MACYEVIFTLIDWAYGMCVLYLLGTFAKLRKAAVSFILSVCLHGTLLSVEKINTHFMCTCF